MEVALSFEPFKIEIDDPDLMKKLQDMLPQNFIVSLHMRGGSGNEAADWIRHYEGADTFMRGYTKSWEATTFEARVQEWLDHDSWTYKHKGVKWPEGRETKNEGTDAHPSVYIKMWPGYYRTKRGMASYYLKVKPC